MKTASEWEKYRSVHATSFAFAKSSRPGDTDRPLVSYPHVIFHPFTMPRYLCERYQWRRSFAARYERRPDEGCWVLVIKETPLDKYGGIDSTKERREVASFSFREPQTRTALARIIKAWGKTLPLFV